MLTIGIVGGIASGKSTVANELRQLGASVLDADLAAHRLLGQPEIRQALLDRWGPTILDEGGHISRRAVAERVFSEADQATADRRFLEKLLHPGLRVLFAAELLRLSESGAIAAVIDAPLLVEAGWDSLCDEVLAVEVGDEVRQKRVSERCWTIEELRRREAAQMPIAEKSRRATYVVRNDGSLEELRAEVLQFWQSRVDVPGVH